MIHFLVSILLFVQLLLKTFSGMTSSIDPDHAAPLEQSDLSLHGLHMPFFRSFGTKFQDIYHIQESKRT